MSKSKEYAIVQLPVKAQNMLRSLVQHTGEPAGKILTQALYLKLQAAKHQRPPANTALNP